MYEFHPDLVAFRPAEQQYKAIVEISKLPEARLIIARHDQTIVGYVTYLYPDPLERWSEGKMENLIELGAIEVVPAFREFCRKELTRGFYDGRLYGRLHYIDD